MDREIEKETPLFKLILPFIIIVMGLIFSFIIFLYLISQQSYPNYLVSLHLSIPWIVLISGLSLSFIMALFLRLWQITQERKKVIDSLTEGFRNEINSRLQGEEVQRKLEKGLLESQKLQAIGTLAGGIAHDFNNILYAIIGYVEMAKEDSPPDSIIHKNLGKVIEAANRGKDLIGRILAFSRKQHVDFVPISLKQTIESVLSLLRPTIPAGVTISFDSDSAATDCKILGNQTQLHQVIMNIINNAVDAMDGEGPIIIHLQKILKEDPLLKQVRKFVNSDFCKIDISDTGHGIDPSTIQRIFEPFFTTKEVGKGTGLGLSTAHNIIHEHNGEILVNSKLGKGTTFSLLLPEDKSL